MKRLSGLFTDLFPKIRTFDSHTPVQIVPRTAPKPSGFENKKYQNMTTRTHTTTNQGPQCTAKEALYGKFGSRAIKTYNTNPMNKNSHTLEGEMKAIDKGAMEWQ